MKWRPWLPLLALGLAAAIDTPVAAKEIVFGGYAWTVRSGHGGPGPNHWDEANVWLDTATNLHLKIAQRDGVWSCAEVTLKQRLGFGRYQFRTSGRLDRFDDNVVLGLFNYPTRDVGSDATHEIDIEFARWGDAKNPMGNFTVWPTDRALKQVTKAFPFALAGDDATHTFNWSRHRIVFRSVDGSGSAVDRVLGEWTYSPEEPAGRISAQPMPVHLNLWLFQGRPPKDGGEVEVIIRDFQYTAEKGSR